MTHDVSNPRDGTDRSDIQGASIQTVRDALVDRDPLPGTRGFAGWLTDTESVRAEPSGLGGQLVRDVLGRYPVFSERGNPEQWSFDPSVLTDPVCVPAGHTRASVGDTRVWTLPEPEPLTDTREAVRCVRTAIVGACDEIALDDTEVAFAFSGGVDSATLAARLPGPLYVVGFPGSHDLTAAQTAADKLDRELRSVELTHADLERAIPAVVRATGRTNAMDVAIALTLYLVAEEVATDGYDRMAIGQGADELFGGYAKVANAPGDPRVQAETLRGAAREMLRSLPGQLARDVLAIRAAGVEPVVPLLDDRVVRAALRLPEGLLVSHGERKYALRLAVHRFLPGELVHREKKAAQYGSLIARELDRLARQSGYKRRMDDHVTRYIESVVQP